MLMIAYVETFLRSMRPAFSRKATWVWFVIVFAGFVVRTDTYGISSIVRALMLSPAAYPCLLHFFHSTAWSAETLLSCWWQWVASQDVAHPINDRIVLLGDHTKNLKDARKMPQLDLLHQDSETASKPAFFRGHHWGAIALLVRAGKRCFGTPLWAEIHHDALEETRTTRIVAVAARITDAIGRNAYLVLDAFFAVGPVFQATARTGGRLHILTRAKKNAVGYLPPVASTKPRRGRRRVYGEKVHLAGLFDAWPEEFKTTRAPVYGKEDTVHYLTLDLLWKPIKGTIRFILIEDARGRIVLMTSDLTLQALDALRLYCHRVSIETMFDSLKNILGALRYHFWSKYLQALSRRLSRRRAPKPLSSKPEKTKATFEAIGKFVIVQLTVLGTLHLLALRFGPQIHATARCWLRTPCGQVPSEFVTRTALANTLRNNILTFAKDTITQIIHTKHNPQENAGDLHQTAA
jgi:hypothetical protein